MQGCNQWGLIVTVLIGGATPVRTPRLNANSDRRLGSFYLY